MKKLTFLALIAIVFASCRNHIDYPITIDRIESSSSYSGGCKYKVYLQGPDASPYFFTDKLYQVGDTLK